IDGGIKPTAVECAFDFKKLPDGSNAEMAVKLHANWCLDFSEYSPGEGAGEPDKADPTADQLDYALVQLADDVGARSWAPSPGQDAPKRGWLRLPDAAPELKPRMGVMIAQHPAGWPLKLAIDTNAIDKANHLWLNKAENRLRYATNTLG